MKKILFLSATLFLFAIANAQPQRTKQIPQGGSDTTWQSLGESRTRATINNGDAKVHTVSGKYDLYATYKNKEVTGYYAINNKGVRIPVSSVTKPDNSAKTVRCFKCVGTVDDKGTKTTDCWDVPCPKSDKADIDPIKIAH